MDYKGLIDGLKGLINDNTTTEDAEKIGKLINATEQLEVDNSTLVAKHEDLRKKYIESIKTASVGGSVENPITETQKPKSFEDCVNDVISQRKK